MSNDEVIIHSGSEHTTIAAFAVIQSKEPAHLQLRHVRFDREASGCIRAVFVSFSPVGDSIALSSFKDAAQLAWSVRGSLVKFKEPNIDGSVHDGLRITMIDHYLSKEKASIRVEHLWCECHK